MTADRLRLTQETITIVTVGLTLLGTILYTSGQLTERVDTLQAEIRANREYFTEQLNADRETFTREILRLTAGQARLAAIVEPIDTP